MSKLVALVMEVILEVSTLTLTALVLLTDLACNTPPTTYSTLLNPSTFAETALLLHLLLMRMVKKAAEL
jgi:hypothetical protein